MARTKNDKVLSVALSREDLGKIQNSLTVMEGLVGAIVTCRTSGEDIGVLPYAQEITFAELRERLAFVNDSLSQADSEESVGA